MKIINFIIFIADPGSRNGSSYFYRGSGIPDPLIFIDPVKIYIFIDPIRTGSSYFYRRSGIPDPDPLIFIADPGSRIRILLFLSRIWDPGSSYSILDLSRIRIQSLDLSFGRKVAVEYTPLFWIWLQTDRIKIMSSFFLLQNVC
jgi:hypothetical protein